MTSPLARSAPRLGVRRWRGCGALRGRLAGGQRRDRRHRRRRAADRLRASAARRGRAAPRSRSARTARWAIHAAIEFGNRMVTFLIAAVAIATFVAAWRSGRDDLRLAGGRAGPRRARAGGARRDHRADRPEPVDGGAPPARVDGDDLRRRAAGAVGVDAGPGTPARALAGPDARARGGRRAALGRGVRRPAGRCSTSARSSPAAARTPATSTRPATGSTPARSASCTPTWCSCCSGSCSPSCSWCAGSTAPSSWPGRAPAAARGRAGPGRDRVRAVLHRPAGRRWSPCTCSGAALLRRARR